MSSFGRHARVASAAALGLFLPAALHAQPPAPAPALANVALASGDIHLLEHVGTPASVASPPPAWRRLAARVAATMPVMPLRRAGPEIEGRGHSATLAVGASDLLLRGYHARTPRLDFSGDAPRADRAAAWGGSATLVSAIGPDDSLSVSLSDERARRRSAFAPQFAQPFSTDTAAAALNWQHGNRLSLGLDWRVTRASGIDTPLAAAANRAAGGEPEGSGLHLTAAYLPFAEAAGPRRPVVTFDLFARRRAGPEFAVPAHEDGATATLRIPF